MGALDHRSEDHPFCPTDRATPTRRKKSFPRPHFILHPPDSSRYLILDLGGEKDFADLVAAAKQRGIKLIVDCTTKLSARKSHRKYNGLVCCSQDKKGYTIPTVGNDRHAFNFRTYKIVFLSVLTPWI